MSETQTERWEAAYWEAVQRENEERWCREAELEEEK